MGSLLTSCLLLNEQGEVRTRGRMIQCNRFEVSEWQMRTHSSSSNVKPLQEYEDDDTVRNCWRGPTLWLHIQGCIRNVPTSPTWSRSVSLKMNETEAGRKKTEREKREEIIKVKEGRKRKKQDRTIRRTEKWTKKKLIRTFTLWNIWRINPLDSIKFNGAVPNYKLEWSWE